jgi:predicted nucleotidyltransferase
MREWLGGLTSVTPIWGEVRLKVDASVKDAILAIVDRRRPSGVLSVWITGSRAKGTARLDSDWDVVAIHPNAHPILPGREGPVIVDKKTISMAMSSS